MTARVAGQTGGVAFILMATLAANAKAATSGRMLRPCRAGTPALTAAKTALEAFSRRIEGLKDGDDAAALGDELAALLRSECFALSAESNFGSPSASNARAFRSWWQGGGNDWVKSYLHADAQGKLHRIVVPPDLPKSLPAPTGDGKPSPALVGLLCPPGNSSCGAEAREFRRRAELYFAGRDRDLLFANPSNPPETPAHLCAHHKSYPDWRQCLDQHRPTTAALPQGQLRSPRGGWLIVREVPRDSLPVAQRCLRTRFFHVDTGSAHVIEACQPSDQTPSKPLTETASQSGHVSEETLRETLLMMLLADTVSVMQTEAWFVEVPKHLTPAWPAGATGSRRGFVPGASPHATLMDWRWQEGAKERDSGSFRVGVDWGGSYAARIFEVLMAGFVPGPAVPLPPEVRLESTSGRPSK
jgi:hypothetical protein